MWINNAIVLRIPLTKVTRKVPEGEQSSEFQCFSRIEAILKTSCIETRLWISPMSISSDLRVISKILVIVYWYWSLVYPQNPSSTIIFLKLWNTKEYVKTLGFRISSPLPIIIISGPFPNLTGSFWESDLKQGQVHETKISDLLSSQLLFYH